MKKMTFVISCILSFCVMQTSFAADQVSSKKTQSAISSKDATQAAQKTLEKIIAAYTTGDLATIEAGIDSKMTGYQELIDGIRQDISKHKNIRIHLQDATITTNAGAVVIVAKWEKRFIPVTAGASPGVVSGNITILMSQYKNSWKISGITGDNFFVKP